MADPHPLGDVAADVRVDRVADRDEILEHGAPGGGRDVEREAPLVAVERLEEERVLALRVGRHVAADVAARAWILDLDHLGAEVGKVKRAERARPVLLERDDPDVLERPHPLCRLTGSRRSASWPGGTGR